MNLVGQVLHSALTGDPCPEWTLAKGKIADERRLVMDLVRSESHPRVYGFTTMVGHLDRHGLNPTDQMSVLRHHLVGTSFPAPELFRRLLTATQLARLSLGETGVSPQAFDATISALSRTGSRPCVGAWSASYGSGDVIPAAWWIDDLLHNELDCLRQGDFICLVNGNWVSSAWAIVALSRAVGCFAQCQSVAAQAAMLYPAHGGQLPISLRDSTPVKQAFRYALTAVCDAVSHRLSSPNGNPLFRLAGDRLTAVSQNSFLEYRLTMALTSLLQAAHLGLSVWQRLILHTSTAIGQNTSVAEYPVQPAKQAQAVLELTRLQAGMLPIQFSGSDSEGVEDLRDLSLATAEAVLRVLAQFENLYSEWSDLGYAPDRSQIALQSKDLAILTFGDQRFGEEATQTELAAVGSRIINGTVRLLTPPRTW